MILTVWRLPGRICPDWLNQVGPKRSAGVYERTRCVIRPTPFWEETRVSRGLRRPVRVLVTAVPATVVVGALVWGSVVAFGAQSTGGRVVTVSSMAQLSSAVASAQPGDRIQLPDGTYSTGTV